MTSVPFLMRAGMTVPFLMRAGMTVTVNTSTARRRDRLANYASVVPSCCCVDVCLLLLHVFTLYTAALPSCTSPSGAAVAAMPRLMSRDASSNQEALADMPSCNVYTPSVCSTAGPTAWRTTWLFTCGGRAAAVWLVTGQRHAHATRRTPGGGPAIARSNTNRATLWNHTVVLVFGSARSFANTTVQLVWFGSPTTAPTCRRGHIKPLLRLPTYIETGGSGKRRKRAA